MCIYSHTVRGAENTRASTRSAVRTDFLELQSNLHARAVTVLILEDYFLAAVDFESKNSQSSDNPIVCKDILLEHAHSFSLILLLAVNAQ